MTGPGGYRRVAVEERGGVERLQINDLVADSDAAAPTPLLPGPLEDREREVLNREVAVELVRGGQPTTGRRVMGVVDGDHDDLNRKRR